jgi:hypothetical protein
MNPQHTPRILSKTLNQSIRKYNSSRSKLKAVDFSRKKLETTPKSKNGARFEPVIKTSDNNPLLQKYQLAASYTSRSIKQKQLEMNYSLRKSSQFPTSYNIFQKSGTS